VLDSVPMRFKAPVSCKTLVFLTNNTTVPALTIAALYTSRWQVELFFKWIKQHLRIKRFLGTCVFRPKQYQRERREDARLVRHRHLCAHGHRQAGVAPQGLARHMFASLVGLGFRDIPSVSRLAA